MFGQIAYEAYVTKARGVSLISWDPLPSWDQLGQGIKDAWEAAAQAVADEAVNAHLAGEAGELPAFRCSADSGRAEDRYRLR